MKVAIVYTGITDGFVEDTSNHPMPRVFNDYIENNLTHFVNPFKEKYNADLYLTTYENKINPSVIEVLKPKKYQILKYAGSAQIPTYVKSMQMMLDEDFDFMLTTRFDLLYRSNVADWNFDFNKFNVLFKENNFKELNLTSDCFYAMPKKYLKSFIIALKQAYSFHPQPFLRKNMHPVTYNFSKIMGKHAVHFLSKKYQVCAEENAFFIAYREKIAKYGNDYELPDFDLPQNLDDTMFNHRKTIDRHFL